MLEWNIGFDPIVHAVGGPVFVDDLAGLTKGPRRTLRLHYFLLATGHAAGLRVATHICEELSASQVDERALLALGGLATRIAWVDGRWCCVGLPAFVVEAICRAMVGGRLGHWGGCSSTSLHLQR